MDRNLSKETKVQHRDGDLPLKIYEKISKVYYHWHDEYEIIYVEKGCCSINIEGESLNVKEGSAVLVKGGLLHSLTVEENSPCSCFALVFHPYMIYGTECKKYFSDDFIFNNLYTAETESGRNILKLIKSAYVLYKERPFAYELYLKSTLADIFCEIFKYKLYTNEKAPEKNSSEAVKSVIDYIHTHFSEKISVEDLSGITNYSKSAIMHNFKEYTGKSISSYINDYRIYNAKQMLKNTEKSVLSIALECGFNEVSYFVKTFRLHTGLSPLKYKKSVAK